MEHVGIVSAQGSLSNVVLRSPRTSIPAAELGLGQILKYGTPRPGLSREVNEFRFKNIPNLMRGARKVLAARALGVPHFYGQLSLMIARCRCGDPDSHLRLALDVGDSRAAVCQAAEWVDLGLVSLRVVTDTGVAFIVDAFQNIVELEIMKFHAIGTGTNAENVTDTALQTELTTEYTTDNTRATGSLAEGATANIFRTVGTNPVDATVALVEHGILSQAAVAGGVLLDRTKFTVINLVSGDSLQSTYNLTFTAGS